MKVTSTRVRIIGGQGIYAVASVTIDNELTINDIIVRRNGNDITVKLPNTENAKRNSQLTIITDQKLFKEIKAKIIQKIAEST
ncbi:MAG: septation protein SpoVG family protein [Ruminococcus sp.]|nr:septation protein SpoVG family protein [Ruminococcus sp.]